MRRSSSVAWSSIMSEPAAADEACHAVSMLPDRTASMRAEAARAAMPEAATSVECAAATSGGGWTREKLALGLGHEL